MPNRDTHLLIGFIIGVAGYAITRWLQNEEIRPLSALIAGAGGAIAGELPDILEPAFSPNHRSHLHSVTTGLTLSYVATQIPTSGMLQSVDSDTKAIAVGVVCGYVSHLLADGTTRKGLPVI